ncbi:5'-nucleotidase [Luteibacter rhizovicinus DSM 16549]|uniref:5'-nucleotidase n=1 Tax=Luteibacter rhizovicinus DSM 16549 TaxID=1440763 RepID=A0A1L3ENN6_9GAMM|nr:5'-nucleotidase [Luteibacter rhizovicinus]APG02679.1 5'-nucleotidase [Luteibacter rhizovicinus DSM 16549]
MNAPDNTSATPTAHADASVNDNRLVVAISSRALFNMEDGHELFERDGLDAYRAYQIERENELLTPGVAFPLVQKLLGLNALSGDVPPVEVILLSRNSGDTGLRIFNAIQHYKLNISRAAFTSGAPTSDYIAPFRADLFLSANAEDVGRALRAGVAAATILPSTAPQRSSEQLRIAFDGDAVIFGDEGERVSKEQGLDAFHRSESELWAEPLSGGPFRGFLSALHRLQAAFPAETSPIRTALVTARSAPAHKRVILTLRRWGVRIDEALFLGGRDKGPFLDAFGADIFFDDSPANVESARKHVATGHVPHGVSNS